MEIIISRYLIEIGVSAIETKLIMDISIKEIPITPTIKNDNITDIIKKYGQFNPYWILKAIMSSIVKIGKLYNEKRLNSSTERIIGDLLEIDEYSDHFFKNEVEQYIKDIKDS